MAKMLSNARFTYLLCVFVCVCISCGLLFVWNFSHQHHHLVLSLYVRITSVCDGRIPKYWSSARRPNDEGEHENGINFVRRLRKKCANTLLYSYVISSTTQSRRVDVRMLGNDGTKLPRKTNRRTHRAHGCRCAYAVCTVCSRVYTVESYVCARGFLWCACGGIYNYDRNSVAVSAFAM